MKHYGNETPTRENKVCNLTISSIFFPFSICTDIGANGFDFFGLLLRTFIPSQISNIINLQNIMSVKTVNKMFLPNER